MFENNLLAGVSGQGGAYSIEDSLRFNDNDSAYLSRTPASAGDRKTWTWSGWVKLGNMAIYRTLFSARLATSNSDTFQIYITPNDQLNAGGVSYAATATPLLRDPSGWYHIVIAYDTTQATDTNRIKFYINGIQADATGTYPSLNLDASINNTQAHNLGRRPTENDRYFDGYMAEVNFIDGQALTADDFGEINSTTGEWSPKAYEGTYGTNGFYLPFNGNANDDSGNGNNWTENNLASTDYMIDTPTNNFSVLNVLATQLTLSEGNLKSSNSVAVYYNSTSTIGMSSGKWYAEATMVVDSAFGTIGITTDPNLSGYAGSTTTSWSYNSRTGDKIHNGSVVSYGATYTTGDVIGIALDLDAGTLSFYKNNVLQGTAYTGLSGTFYFVVSMYDSSTWVTNFGQDSSFAGLKTRQGNTDDNGIGDFYYTPPTGYLALCTDNLPAPAIEQPETQFNVVTYTGDGTTPQAITGAGFQPDLVWIKRRDSAADNTVLDSIRGDARLETNNTDAELGGNSNIFSSFDSDGFTIGLSSQVGASGGTYVAWCWKAGGTAVTNTDGVTSGVFTAVTSQVSANVDSGFSIQTYTAPASGKPSWGHGLGVTPKVLILKRRDGTGNWEFISPELIGASYGLRLNTTAAATNYTNNYAFFDSSKIDIGNATYNLTGSADYVAYTFAEVESFSKFGSFVGNGSSNGPFVYTGFKPAFVIVKSTDISANWVMYDNERTPVNQINTMLFSNSSGADYTDSTIGIDFLSNGFKLRSTNNNTNGNTNSYIYMAFAEHPFNYATGR